MTRWEPDARGRLADAALELFAERGFEGTTVADIAERARLTERTFFRHFADKREVVFAGDDARDVLVAGVAAAPASATALDAACAGFEAVAGVIDGRRDFALRRQAAIAASPELQERELIKLASWADAVRAALVDRGVDGPEAELAAQVALAVFRSAFHRWITGPKRAELTQIVHRTARELRTLTA